MCDKANLGLQLLLNQGQVLKKSDVVVSNGASFASRASAPSSPPSHTAPGFAILKRSKHGTVPLKVWLGKRKLEVSGTPELKMNDNANTLKRPNVQIDHLTKITKCWARLAIC